MLRFAFIVVLLWLSIEFSFSYKPYAIISSGFMSSTALTALSYRTASIKRVIPQGVERRNDLLNPNRLKILAGTRRGMKIDSPDVYLRPMMSKVCYL
jgi:hypothetical protein